MYQGNYGNEIESGGNIESLGSYLSATIDLRQYSNRRIYWCNTMELDVEWLSRTDHIMVVTIWDRYIINGGRQWWI